MSGAVNLCRRRLAAGFALGPAVALLQACGSAPTVHEAPRPASPSTPSLPPASAEAGRPEVAIYAMGLVGTPYRFGGNTPQSGFDCSGLIAYVFSHAARLPTPRTVAELGRWGQPVPLDQARTGDIVLFGRGPVPSHAGIVVEGGRFVHAPSTGGTVRIDPWRVRHWQVQLMGFRRG